MRVVPLFKSASEFIVYILVQTRVFKVVISTKTSGNYESNRSIFDKRISHASISRDRSLSHYSLHCSELDVTDGPEHNQCKG